MTKSLAGWPVWSDHHPADNRRNIRQHPTATAAAAADSHEWIRGLRADDNWRIWCQHTAADDRLVLGFSPEIYNSLIGHTIQLIIIDYELH